MTIVCALKDPIRGGVWIGSDTMAVNCQVKEHNGPKWVSCAGPGLSATAAITRQTRYVVGVAGQIRALNIVKAKALAIAACVGFADILDVIEGAITADKWKPREEPGEPPYYKLEFIVTDGDRLISVGGSFSFVECDSFAVIGSGSEAALGARFVLVPMTDTEQLLRSMLCAAVEVNHNCGGVIVVEHIPAPEDRQ